MNKIILISLLCLSSSVFAQSLNIDTTKENVIPIDQNLDLNQNLNILSTNESNVKLITSDMVIEVKNNSKANELVNTILEVQTLKEELLKKSYILEHEIAMLELQHKKEKLEDNIKLYHATREEKVKFNIEDEKNEINKSFKMLEELKKEMSMAEKLESATNKIADHIEVLNVSSNGVDVKVEAEKKSQ